MSLLGDVQISQPGAVGDGFIVRRIKLGLIHLPEVEVYARTDGVVKIQPMFPRGSYLGQYRSGDNLDRTSAIRWIRRELAVRVDPDPRLIDEIMEQVELTVELLRDDLVRALTPTHK